MSLLQAGLLVSVWVAFTAPCTYFHSPISIVCVRLYVCMSFRL